MSRKKEMQGLLEAIRALKEKYPEEDVFGKINREFGIQPILASGSSRIAIFKDQVIASFGTEHEMSFNEIEDGFVQAMRVDGQAAIKEVLEEMPVSAPTCADGAKMNSKGRVKKTS
ncbi:MAG: hypothetical protein LBI12_02320 [Treponema sp.]|nr:hypothetical protein [Treponema sp.]